jgi:UDPglucose 6-dehydrogenase
VYEPGLDGVVARARGRNLHFTTAVEEAIGEADMVFISVNTPTKTKGLGAGKASDLKWVEASARSVAKAARGHTIVVEKSTLPVRTAEVITWPLHRRRATAAALRCSPIPSSWRRAPPSATLKTLTGC